MTLIDDDDGVIDGSDADALSRDDDVNADDVDAYGAALAVLASVHGRNCGVVLVMAGEPVDV